MSGSRTSSSKSLPLMVALLLCVGILPAWSEERIVLDGSSGMLPLAKILAAAHQQKFSDPRVEIGNGLGTGARLRALAEDKIQVALASHGIRPEDLQKGNLKVIEVAKGAFVIKAEPTPSIRKFVDFVLSPDGDRVILANGAVPLR